ncbi:glycosyltransferase family 8 protein [Kaistia nematophila]|uniref:Glycosyltransferase family 8 protein n=1 Tax=Kaistia nematophila TaxID=2994654 RepID=A0A9X3E4R4_9HYPH|nr:glycosyltransferase [Kaistia nematophila]MCX5569683.1 hypothetical protein [Kaistia nematophila]
MRNVVYFVVNDRFLPIALAVSSALVREPGRNFDVAILLDGEPAAGYRVPDGVRILPNDLGRYVPEGLENTGAAWARMSFTRMFAPMVFAGTYDRALYLDADVSVLGPVSPLFEMDMRGLPLAAGEGMMDEGASQHGFDVGLYKKRLGITDGRTFNSGLLLMDVEKWNALDHRAMLQSYAAFKRESAGPGIGMSGDQDYLNFSLKGAWNCLSPRWNFQTFLLRLELESLIDPAIVHYVGPRRPWDARLFPFGDHHIAFYDQGFERIGLKERSGFRAGSYHWHAFCDQLRQAVYNHAMPARKREMFEEWSRMRRVFKRAIQSRLDAGQYQDVVQGISRIDLSDDPFEATGIEDVVYYRKRIRVRAAV